MIRLISVIGRWIASHLVLFGVIILILALSQLSVKLGIFNPEIKKELTRLESLAKSFPEEAASAIKEISAIWPKEIERSPPQIRGAQNSIAYKKQDLLDQRAMIIKASPLAHRIPGTESWQEIAIIDLKIKSIEGVQSGLEELLVWSINIDKAKEQAEQLTFNRQQIDQHIGSKERKRGALLLSIDKDVAKSKSILQQQTTLSEQISRNSQELKRISDANRIWVNIPGTGPYKRWNSLAHKNMKLRLTYTRQDAEYKSHRELEQRLRNELKSLDGEIRTLESLKGNRSKALNSAKEAREIAERKPAPNLDTSLAESLRSELMNAIEIRLDELRNESGSKLLDAIASAFESHHKKAIIILVALIAAPFLNAFIAYYVFAGVASNRFSLLLEKRSDGRDSSAPSSPSSSSAKITSGRSIPIQVTQQNALIVRPQFKESSPSDARASTVWVYDWRRPIMCIASNLIAMTRFESNVNDEVRLSSTSDDHAQLAAIPLSEGESLVVRPRSVIGIVQDRTNPVRVRTIWHLFSLGCWLRLQIRFIVFSGPGQIILQGHNGVIVESADSGRTISQAATLAYSTRVTYSATRCDTFGGYITGAQALFNDRFQGKGVYVYEATPRSSSMRHGPTRLIQDLADALLRAFGI